MLKLYLKEKVCVFFLFLGSAMQYIQATSQNFFSWGTCSQKNATANFFLGLNRDHLGNVRLSYADTDNSGDITQNEIIQEKHYYPFGGRLAGINSLTTANGNSVAQKFGFGGKELSEELGINWHDFDARNYDASLGRWMNIDPLAELMTRHSPYNFAFDNPIYFIDPDGMSPCPNGNCGPPAPLTQEEQELVGPLPEPKPEPEPPLGIEWLGTLNDYMQEDEFTTTGIATIAMLVISIISLPLLLQKRKRLSRVIAARNRRAGAKNTADEFDDFFD